MSRIVALFIVMLSCAWAQKYPTSIATDSDLMVAKNRISTKLIAAVGSTDTVIAVQSGTGIVANMLVTIDSEVMAVCGVSGNLVQIGTADGGTCPNVSGRGFDGTSAASHSSGKAVSAYITAYHHEAIKKEVIAIQQTLGTKMTKDPSGRFYVGKGVLEGYGMSGTGLDTPTLAIAAEGSLSSPSSSTYPAYTWSRINNGVYSSGLGNYVFYGLKTGPSGGSAAGNAMENVTISTRQDNYPGDLVGLYNRVVMSEGTGTGSTAHGIGWAYLGSVQKSNQYDWISVMEMNPDNQSRVDAGGTYGAVGYATSSGIASIGAGNAKHTNAFYVGAQLNAALLAANIDGSVTSFTVNDASQFNYPATFIIGTEQIRCTALSTNTFSSCTRGYNSTVAASHTAGDTVTPTAPFPQFWNGIEIAYNAIVPGYYSLIMPNTTSVASWSTDGLSITKLLYQSVDDTVINAKSGSTIFFAHNNVGGVQIDGSDELKLADKTYAQLGGGPVGVKMANCTNCDPPTAEGDTCTTGGASSGAFAVSIRGTWKCYGR